MAIVTSYSGSLTLALQLLCAYSGERTGSEQADDRVSVQFDPAGGDAPTLSGFLEGVAAVTNTPTDLLLAHATDPLQGLGSARYSEGFSVASSKIKVIHFRNEDATNSVIIARAAANGLPLFEDDEDALRLGPGDFLTLTRKAGLAALTTGGNDALTVVTSAGTASLRLIVGYGP